jgi:hypothetical protein
VQVPPNDPLASPTGASAAPMSDAMRPTLLVPLGAMFLLSPGCRHDEAARQSSPPEPVTEMAAAPSQVEYEVVTYDGDTVTLGEVDPRTGKLLPPPPLLAAPFPELLHPRCERVMPGGLKLRFFPASEGWQETRFEGLDPTTCAYQLGESSVEASVTYLCGEGMSPPEPGSYAARLPEGATAVEKLGHLAYFAPEQAGLRMDIWNDDTPCRLVVRWEGPGQHQHVVALGRAAAEAAQPHTVLQPTKVALLSYGDESTPDVTQRFSQWRERTEARLNKDFELAPGFPKLIGGFEAPGYEPNRVVFVVGICQADEEAVRVFRAMSESEVGREMGGSTRLVELAEKDFGCPKRRP